MPQHQQEVHHKGEEVLNHLIQLFLEQLILTIVLVVFVLMVILVIGVIVCLFLLLLLLLIIIVIFESYNLTIFIFSSRKVA